VSHSATSGSNLICKRSHAEQLRNAPIRLVSPHQRAQCAGVELQDAKTMETQVETQMEPVILTSDNVHQGWHDRSSAPLLLRS